MAECVWILGLAVLLDLGIGDPSFRGHPVRLLGVWISVQIRGWLACFRCSRLLAGLVLIPGTLLPVLLLLVFFHLLPSGVGRMVLGGVLLWASMALRDLLAHGWRVYRALSRGDLAGARVAVGMMVGRETTVLDESGVVRATLESLGENLSDSWVSALFWFGAGSLVGPVWGVGLALGVRTFNTLDAMVGYREEPFHLLGRPSARGDDLLQFLPARLTGLLLVGVSPVVGGSMLRAWKVLVRDRLKHDSPNSAHGEAALAGALGVRLGGPTLYGSGWVDKPWLGEEGREAVREDLWRGVILVGVSGMLFALVVHVSVYALS